MCVRCSLLRAVPCFCECIQFAVLLDVVFVCISAPALCSSFLFEGASVRVFVKSVFVFKISC